jgi:hypothetical protein
MKIEFAKLPRIENKFEISSNSVKFSGTFCRISGTIARIHSTIVGKYDVECCKCAKTITKDIDENIVYTLSDGSISLKDERENEIIIEIENHIVDFDNILNSELESIKSDYYVCDDCTTDENFVDIEI